MEAQSRRSAAANHRAAHVPHVSLLPVGVWGTRAVDGAGGGGQRPMAGLLGGLECRRARGGGAQRGVNAQEWDWGGGGEMRKNLGEGFAGWRNSSRNPIPTVGSVHSAAAFWAIRGAPGTPSTPACLHPSH